MADFQANHDPLLTTLDHLGDVPEFRATQPQLPTETDPLAYFAIFMIVLFLLASVWQTIQFCTRRAASYANVIHVCGPIGGGKTTLVNSFGDIGFRTHTETVDEYILEQYITPSDQRWRHTDGESVNVAWLFQAVMMTRALERTRMAAKDSSNMPNVVERPWYENWVFAWANYVTGSISPREYSTYMVWMTEFAHTLSEKMQDGIITNVDSFLLYRTPDRLADSVTERGRVGEKDYKADYLELLAHGHLMLYLRSHLLGPRKSHTPRLIMLDWNNFGDAASDSIVNPDRRRIEFVSPQSDNEKKSLLSQLCVPTHYIGSDAYHNATVKFHTALFHSKRDDAVKLQCTPEQVQYIRTFFDPPELTPPPSSLQ